MNIELKRTYNRFNVDVSKEFGELIERFKEIEKKMTAPDEIGNGQHNDEQ